MKQPINQCVFVDIAHLYRQQCGYVLQCTYLLFAWIVQFHIVVRFWITYCVHEMWYLLCPRERLQSIVMSMSVCLSARISLEPRAIFTKFLCMLFMFLARSSSGMLMIGRNACRRELGRGDGNAQLGRSVIYDCLVKPAIKHKNMKTTHFSRLKVWLKLTLKL